MKEKVNLFEIINNPAILDIAANENDSLKSEVLRLMNVIFHNLVVAGPYRDVLFHMDGVYDRAVSLLSQISIPLNIYYSNVACMIKHLPHSSESKNVFIKPLFHELRYFISKSLFSGGGAQVNAIRSLRSSLVHIFKSNNSSLIEQTISIELAASLVRVVSQEDSLRLLEDLADILCLFSVDSEVVRMYRHMGLLATTVQLMQHDVSDSCLLSLVALMLATIECKPSIDDVGVLESAIALVLEKLQGSEGITKPNSDCRILLIQSQELPGIKAILQQHRTSSQVGKLLLQYGALTKLLTRDPEAFEIDERVGYLDGLETPIRSPLRDNTSHLAVIDKEPDTREVYQLDSIQIEGWIDKPADEDGNRGAVEEQRDVLTFTSVDDEPEKREFTEQELRESTFRTKEEIERYSKAKKAKTEAKAKDPNPKVIENLDSDDGEKKPDLEIDIEQYAEFDEDGEKNTPLPTSARFGMPEGNDESIIDLDDEIQAGKLIPEDGRPQRSTVNPILQIRPIDSNQSAHKNIEIQEPLTESTFNKEALDASRSRLDDSTAVVNRQLGSTKHNSKVRIFVQSNFG